MMSGNSERASIGSHSSRSIDDPAPALRPRAGARGRTTRAILVSLGVLALLFVSVARLPVVLSEAWADQLVSQGPAFEPVALIAAPLDQAGGQPSDSAERAIQDVIERANSEQAQAIAARDPSVMADTATSAHYQELVGINRGLLGQGVTRIDLVRLEWGAIAVSGATASATVDETWTTTYADGTTELSRDRNVYSLVQENGAWKIQSDDHPDATGAARAAEPSPDQPQPSARVPAGSDTSHNWSGYAATGGRYTAVGGTWTVPQPSTEGSFGADAVWVGIGGVRSRDLIQAGTDTAVSGSGRARFQAWVEMLPQAARPVPLAVYPGDSVTVSIVQQGPETWQVAFANNTTGQTYQETERYASSGSSAEWVVEAPFSQRGLLPLDDFGRVSFSGGSAVKDGQRVTIVQAGAEPITMIGQRNEALAVPSPLAEDGAGFSVARTAVPSSQPTAGFSRGRRNYQALSAFEWQ